MKKNLHIDEVSEILGCSKSTVYRIITEGDLKAFQLRNGGTLRIPASELERFQKERIQAYLKKMEMS